MLRHVGCRCCFWSALAHAAVLAPLTPVADALALGSASAKSGFPYGWVRGAGSAAFIGGALLSGQLIERAGLGIIIWLNASLLAVAAVVALRVPDRFAGSASAVPTFSGSHPWRALLSIPVFVRLMIVAALIGGSHALHDGFEVIRWRAAGMSASQASVLWSLSVAAEVVVFLVAGRRLLATLGPAGSMALSAAAGAVRWAAAATTASFPVMAVVEPLHGLTFALLHLTCMDVISRTVPKVLAATAQAFYATIAMGAFSTLVTLAAGWLYEDLGAASFWLMALMCSIAVPIALGLKPPAGD